MAKKTNPLLKEAVTVGNSERSWFDALRVEDGEAAGFIEETVNTWICGDDDDWPHGRPSLGKMRRLVISYLTERKVDNLPKRSSFEGYVKKAQEAHEKEK